MSNYTSNATRERFPELTLNLVSVICLQAKRSEPLRTEVCDNTEGEDLNVAPGIRPVNWHFMTLSVEIGSIRRPALCRNERVGKRALLVPGPGATQVESGSRPGGGGLFPLGYKPLVFLAGLW